MPIPHYQKESGAFIFTLTPAEREVQMYSIRTKQLEETNKALLNKNKDLLSRISNLEDKMEHLLKELGEE